MNVVPAEKQIKRKGCFKQGRVSVVVPVYNTKPCLRRSVNSVIEQTFSFIELILVDDGSTDGSSEICDEFAAIDDRVRVVHQQNLGPSAARNRGMEAASGDYLYFLDSDDWIAPDTIEKLYRRACMDRLDVLFFDGITTNEAGVIKQGPQIYCRQASYNGVYQGVALLNAMKTHHEYRVCIPLMFIRRAFLMKESLSFFEGILHEDELFSFMLMLRADRCGHVPEPLFFRRIRRGSIMMTPQTERNVRDCVRVLEEAVLYYNKTKKPDSDGQEAIWAHLKYFFWNAYTRLLALQVKGRAVSPDVQGRLFAFMEQAGYFNDRAIRRRCRFHRFFATAAKCTARYRRMLKRFSA